MHKYTTLPRDDSSSWDIPPAGRPPGQLAAILEALAAVTSFATLSIRELLHWESPRLPWGATLVVVTAVVTDGLAATILRLRDAGRRMVLVSLADDPPPQLDGVPAFHLSSATPAFQRFGRGPYDATAALVAAGLTLRAGRSAEAHPRPSRRSPQDEASEEVRRGG